MKNELISKTEKIVIKAMYNLYVEKNWDISNLEYDLCKILENYNNTHRYKVEKVINNLINKNK